MASSRFICLILLMCGALSSPHCCAIDLKVEIQEKSDPKFVVSFDKGAESIGGLCVDILRSIERSDPDLHFSFALPATPLARIVKNLEMGSADANCLVQTPERLPYLPQTSLPLFSYDYHLIARAGDQVQIANWDDVRKMGRDGEILVLKNSGSKAKLMQIGGITIDDGAETVEQNLQKLVAGRARFFFYHTTGIQEKLKLAGVAGQVKILPNIVESVQFRLLFGKNVPKELVQRIDSNLIERERDGTLKKIREKWNIPVIH